MQYLTVTGEVSRYERTVLLGIPTHVRTRSVTTRLRDVYVSPGFSKSVISAFLTDFAHLNEALDLKKRKARLGFAKELKAGGEIDGMNMPGG